MPLVNVTLTINFESHSHLLYLCKEFKKSMKFFSIQTTIYIPNPFNLKNTLEKFIMKTKYLHLVIYPCHQDEIQYKRAKEKNSQTETESKSKIKRELNTSCLFSPF